MTLACVLAFRPLGRMIPLDKLFILLRENYIQSCNVIPFCLHCKKSFSWLENVSKFKKFQEKIS